MFRMLIVVCLVSSFIRTSRVFADPADGATIERLIGELGDDEYAVRRRAEEELIRLGPDAFDELKGAVDHPDLEVSERVRYILERLRVEWIRPEDPPEVRRLLTRYSDLGDGEKMERIARLGALPDGGGDAALCRIARLDLSPLMARRAALALIQPRVPPDAKSPHREACLAELGVGTRAPVEWIRLHLDEDQSPEETAAAWDQFAEAEQALVDEDSAETNFDVLQSLLEHELHVCDELKLTDATLTALERIIDRSEISLDDAAPTVAVPSEWGLEWSLRWILKHRRWDVVPGFKERYGQKLEKSRLSLYLLAAATAGAEGTESATELADRAFNMQAEDDPFDDDHDDEDERIDVAELLAAVGQVEWAEREFRRTIEKHPDVGWRSMKARYELAAWLFDRQDYQGAADLLGEFLDALTPATQRQLLEEMQARRESRRFLDIPTVSARRQYYQSFYHESRGEYDEQRKCLEKASAANASDPDILIAMFRVPEADEEFRQRTRAAIRKMNEAFQAEIEEYPDDPNAYNQWAWLIGNTEGDFAKAVAYSQRSLEIRPDEPSYLDTLGRCYYAAGDLDNAIKAQQRAVELTPHYGVMRRQLELFQREAASKQP
jgi:tetratricopeptide (TPR) repeat protein